MIDNDVIYLVIRGVQIATLSCASFYLIAHGRETIPAVFEPITVLFLLDFMLIALALPRELGLDFYPTPARWAWLMYGVMLPLVVLRMILVQLRHEKKELWRQPY